MVHQMRSIDDILHFRHDISPFLVHLTRATKSCAADQILKTIIAEKQLRPGADAVSVARYGGFTTNMPREERRKLFSAICFTETPLSEVHSLLEIENRRINLEPYGLVFLRERLQQRGVAPVAYLNNEAGDQDVVVRALFALRETEPEAAYLLLPLLHLFGKKLRPPGANPRLGGTIDWRWEREWRRPYVRGSLAFDDDDVFVGLCPDDQISAFESSFDPVGFIDPRLNMKWYASKLIQARQRLHLKHSVV